MTVAKSTKGGLGRGLDALLGSYEETIAPATRPAPAARPAQVPAPNEQRIEEEEEFEREEINETYPEDNIHIKGVVQRRAATQPVAAPANVRPAQEVSPRIVEQPTDEVSIECVTPNPDQPRTQFKREELQEAINAIVDGSLILESDDEYIELQGKGEIELSCGAASVILKKQIKDDMYFRCRQDLCANLFAGSG